MFKKSPAVRENVKLKIGMSGPSGSGKTYSALQLAYGLTGDWTKVTVADTENRSALYYAGMGLWEHIPFDPNEQESGYNPQNWVKLISYAESDPNTEVLILDSISHEWEGKGGCLELVDKISQRGNSFASWKTVTPLHSSFLDAMRLSRLHIIACMRSKQDYVLEQNDKGKAVPRKVGLKSIQREGADYEFGLVFDIGMNHFATSSKDRTGIFAPRGEFQITPAIGEELIDWATSGLDVPRPQPTAPQAPELFAGTQEQQDKAVAYLKQCKIAEDVWDTIYQLMLDKPFSKGRIDEAIRMAIKGS